MIHFQCPSGIERKSISCITLMIAYYQETGRAGRDGHVS